MADSGRTGLVAVPQESGPLLGKLQNAESILWGETILHTGRISDHAVALAEILPGPVNAAIGAQALVACYGVSRLLSFGSAGALDPALAPGDLVIAHKAVAHDAGMFLGRRFKPGGVIGRDNSGRIGHRRAFTADPGLVQLALNAAETLPGHVVVGTVATGNQFVGSTARKRWLHQTFGAAAVEMETAAVAQVAVAHRLPWIAIRAISDVAGDDLILDYERLRIYLDDDTPAWRYGARRWFYLLTHLGDLGRLRRLRRGLALAAGRAGWLVAEMLRR